MTLGRPPKKVVACIYIEKTAWDKSKIAAYKRGTTRNAMIRKLIKRLAED